MFNLQFAFARAGALPEDFQDQRGAIHDFAAEDFFQVARLRGGKFVVEDDRVHVVRLAERGKFRGLARPDVSGGDGRGHFLHTFADDLGAGGLGELGEFGEGFTDIGGSTGFKFNADEEDAFRPVA